MPYAIRGRIDLDQIQVAVKAEHEGLPLTPQDFIDAYKGLLWLIESMLQSTERYWQSRIRLLRTKDVEVDAKSRFAPIKGGIKLVIEVKPTEDTVIYFAEKHYLLDRILKARVKSLKETARQKYEHARAWRKRRTLKKVLYQEEIRKRVS